MLGSEAVWPLPLTDANRVLNGLKMQLIGNGEGGEAGETDEAVQRGRLRNS